MTPQALYYLARDVYAFVQENQPVARSAINSHFRTSSDDRKNAQLSEAIDVLLARLYLFRFTDEGTLQVFFWTPQIDQVPYEPDQITIPDPLPLDPFGPPPAEAKADEEVPDKPDPMEEREDDADDEEPLDDEEPVQTNQLPPDSPEYKAMMKMHEKSVGVFRQFYEVMMESPRKLYGKNDPAFDKVSPDHQTKARFLGRMFGLGIIRRLMDPKDKTVAYYTICGECPESLVEDKQELSKAAQRRKAEANEAAGRQQQINTVKQGLGNLQAVLHPTAQQQVVEKEEEDEEEVEDIEEPVEVEHIRPADVDHTQELEVDGPVASNDEEESDVDTEEREPQEPEAYLSNKGRVYVIRKDGEAIDFNEEESMAIIELFISLNQEALRDRFLAYQQKKEAQ